MHARLRRHLNASRGQRLVHRIGWVLLGVLILVIVLVGILILADRLQRQRVIREQAALAEGGHFLDVAGVTVHYRESGPGSDGSVADPAAPLVLIHGLLGSSQDFEFIQQVLAQKRPVIAVDLIGFGLSDKSTALNFSKRAMADTIAGLMEQLGYTRYAILGHSMGGEVALHLALAYPDRVARIVLLDSAGLAQTAPGHSDGPTAGTRPTQVPSCLIDLVFQNYYVERQVFRTCLADPKPYLPLAFDKLYYFVAQIPPETLAHFIADSDSGSIADRLGTISQSTWIIWGEQDRIIPLTQGRLLQAAIPGSTLQVIPECGHLPYLEKPDELVALIDYFLE